MIVLPINHVNVFYMKLCVKDGSQIKNIYVLLLDLQVFFNAKRLPRRNNYRLIVAYRFFYFFVKSFSFLSLWL